MTSFFRDQNAYAWCSIVDALQTAAISDTNDYKLHYLAKVFQLSDSLFY